MKKLILIFASLVFALMIQAKSLTVNVITPGTLSTLVSYSDSLTDLTITGTIDSTDCRYIADSLFASTNTNFKGADTLDLSHVTFVDNEIKKFSFRTTRIKYILFPNTLTHIGFGAFRTNSFISITFPKSVNKIEPGAFNSSYSLKSIIFLSEIVIKTSDSVLGFSRIDTANIKLFVPSNLVDFYKKDSVWKNFRNIIGIVSNDSIKTITKSTDTTSIKLNGAWSAESSESFITFNQSSGTIDSVLTINIAENTTDSTRTAYIKIIVDDTTSLKAYNIKTITLTIKQLSTSTISVVKEVRTNKLNVYPNPCKNYIYTNKNDDVVSIYTLNGTIVSKTNVINNESVDMSNLTTGSYIIKSNNESVIVVKQ
jgi:hypothetical protein